MELLLALPYYTLRWCLTWIDLTSRTIDFAHTYASQLFNQQYLSITHHKHESSEHLTLPIVPIHVAILHAHLSSRDHCVINTN